MNSLSGRKVFVTGATGILGGALTRLLVDSACEVTVLVRDAVPRAALWSFRDKNGSPLRERIQIVHGDITDFALLLRALNEGEIDLVFHLAAQTIVGIAGANPLSTFESNVRGTYLLLEACRSLKERIRGVVVASSDKAYGVSDNLPYQETATLQGKFPYDVSKACADLLTQAYHHAYGLPAAVTRCANLYGPGDLNENRLIPGTIRFVLDGKRPIVRSDGSLVRDYLYVEDAARGYLLIAERLLESSERVLGEAFNFSPEAPMTVLEVVHEILRQMGREDLEPDVRRTSTLEIPKQTLNAAKAAEVLGWAPGSGFEESLARTIEWYREFWTR